MNSPAKILLIDNAADRKDRINALKNRGYAVFPTLRREEARSRCLRGGYDLIVINAGDEHEQAAQYCDDIRKQCPRQLLLMCSKGNTERDYAVPLDTDSLLRAVDSVLNQNAKGIDLADAA